ncbi:MAG TPA: hypothetical protein GX532_01450 [Clostridia bacterium]|jgi:hypothetical protein|nr:hypothetical protein [Clostridia bacterium]
MEELNYKVTFAEGQEEAKHCDTYRLGYSEKDIFLDFGVLVRDEHSEKIEAAEILSRIALPIEALEQFLMALFLTGRQYEAEYKRDIGMSLDEDS